MFKFCQNNVLTILFMIKLLKQIIFFIFLINVSFANEIKVFDFTSTELDKLEVRKVRGAKNKTIYSIGNNDKGNFLKAVADNSASGLGKEIEIDSILHDLATFGAGRTR